MLFKVTKIDDYSIEKKIYTVYAVTSEAERTLFLIWNSAWFWVESKYYKPTEKE